MADRPINVPSGDRPSQRWTKRLHFFWMGKSAEFRNLTCAGVVLVLMALLLLLVFVLIPVVRLPPACDAQHICSYSIVESIPYGINTTLRTKYSIYDALIRLISEAKSTIDMSAFYMTLNVDDYPGQGTEKGRAVYQQMYAAAARGVKIRIALSAPFGPDGASQIVDALAMQKDGVAEVRIVDMDKLLHGGGVLHTKFLVTDQRDFFVGSANMDWRSLTQVKELGLHTWNCPCLAVDIEKVFEVYWTVGENNVLPAAWSGSARTTISEEMPATVSMNGESDNVFLSVSPLEFCAGGRTWGKDAIVHSMNEATSYINIEVMDYSPTTLFKSPRTYWPYFDDAMRWAALRGVKVHFLAALWNHTKTDMISYLRSLNDIPNVQVKFFVVPDNHEDIPYSRVNHAKFLTSNTRAIVSTSNWSGDYFETTAGVSFVSNHTMLRNDLEDIFWRDWTSPFAHDVNSTWPVMAVHLFPAFSHWSGWDAY